MQIYKLSNTSLLLSATLGPNQAVSERASVSRGRHHTYGTELRTDTTSCSGFTVAAKGQRAEERGGLRGEKNVGQRDAKREVREEEKREK